MNVGIIDSALEAVTRANESMGARGLLPDIGEAIRNGLRWRPEPWRGERFDLATECARRGWGDCDDLGPWLAAQLRLAGTDARAFARKSGRNRYHVQVETADGRILDPSVWAGMRGKPEGAELGRTMQAVAGYGETSICAIPHRGFWHARADLPLGDGIHVAGYAASRDPHEALIRAIAPYCCVTEGYSEIGDDTVGLSLGDIVATAAPLAGGALGGPLGAALGGLAGPMAGNLVNKLTGSGSKPASNPAPAGNQDIAAAIAPAATPMANAVRNLTSAQPIAAAPVGFPQGAMTYPIPGPAGVTDGKVTLSPQGGPIIIRF